MNIRPVLSVVLVLSCLVAPVAARGATVYIVQSITPIGDRWDVKLQNPRTRYVHSVTVYQQPPFKVGDRVTEPLPGSQRPARRPAKPNDPQTNKYPAAAGDGTPLEYFIDGLGTGNVTAFAWNSATRTSTDISAAILTRSQGQNRPFKPEEQLFDALTGARWNWVGSDRSGGRTIRPGGIGNVNVLALNDFDLAAKKHDINAWFSANFEVGAKIRLKVRGYWISLVVLPDVDVHLGAVAEFLEATDLALRNAVTRLTQAHVRAIQDGDVEAVLNILPELMSVRLLRAAFLYGGPLAQMEAMAAVLDNQFRLNYYSHNKGLFGEKLTAHALAAKRHTILEMKPDVDGTTRPGIDMVTRAPDGRLWLIDNKALTSPNNIASVTALTDNLAKNVRLLIAQFGKYAVDPARPANEQQLYADAVDDLTNGRYDLVVTNATWSQDDNIPLGLTAALRRRGIRFENVFPP